MNNKKITQSTFDKYRPWILSIVSRSLKIYPKNPRWDADEFESSAWLGFIKAWESFDDDYGVPFKAYARRQIVHEIQKHVSANMFTLTASWEYVKDNEKIVTRLNELERHAVRQWNHSSENTSEYGMPSFEEMLPHGVKYSNTLDAMIAKENGQLLRNELVKLKPIVKKVIHFYFVKGMTLHEIGKKCNRSHEWVRLTLNKTIKSLKQKFENRGWTLD